MRDNSVRPTLKDIELAIKSLSLKFSDLVKAEVISYSHEKRPVWMVKITAPEVNDNDKQNVLIVGGHHGNEESGRAGCLGLMEWLVTKEAKKVRESQVVLIVPCVNVDGAFYNTLNNKKNVDLCRDYFIETGPVEPETKGVKQLVDKYQPDVVVDVHGLAGGAVHEMVMTIPTRQYSVDEWIHNLIASEMRKGAERKGYPQDGHSLSWTGWFDKDGKDKIGYLITYCYKKFHSIGLLTESNESTFTLNEMKESGLIRLISLLKIGTRKFSWEPYKGYPNSIIAGSFFKAIADYGKTFKERTKSRLDILKNLDEFYLRRCYPEKRGMVKISLEYKGDRLTNGLSIRCRIRGFIRVKSVSVNDKILNISDIDGYFMWKDSCSTFVQLNFPQFNKGEYIFKITYKR